MKTKVIITLYRNLFSILKRFRVKRLEPLLFLFLLFITTMKETSTGEVDTKYIMSSSSRMKYKYM